MEDVKEKREKREVESANASPRRKKLRLSRTAIEGWHTACLKHCEICRDLAHEEVRGGSMDNRV